MILTISAVEFTIDSTDAENAITGFDIIRRGVTLKNTQSSADGATTTAPDSMAQQPTLKNLEELMQVVLYKQGSILPAHLQVLLILVLQLVTKRFLRLKLSTIMKVVLLTMLVKQ